MGGERGGGRHLGVAQFAGVVAAGHHGGCSWGVGWSWRVVVRGGFWYCVVLGSWAVEQSLGQRGLVKLTQGDPGGGGPAGGEDQEGQGANIQLWGVVGAGNLGFGSAGLMAGGGGRYVHGGVGGLRQGAQARGGCVLLATWFGTDGGDSGVELDLVLLSLLQSRQDSGCLPL